MSKILWTIWEFRGVTVPQGPTVRVRRAEPNDLAVQHEYQRVLRQVWAFGPKDALAPVVNP